MQSSGSRRALIYVYISPRIAYQETNRHVRVCLAWPQSGLPVSTEFGGAIVLAVNLASRTAPRDTEDSDGSVADLGVVRGSHRGRSGAQSALRAARRVYEGMRQVHERAGATEKRAISSRKQAKVDEEYSRRAQPSSDKGGVSRKKEDKDYVGLGHSSEQARTLRRDDDVTTER